MNRPSSLRHLLWVVILLAFVVRIVRINQTPDLDSDQLLYMAEALSVSYTGTDTRQSGQPPLYLRGHSDTYDNRTSVLSLYLSLPLHRLLGPSLVSARLPSILVGTATVWLVASLLLMLTRRTEAALAGSLFLALSQRHLHFSRLGTEFIFLPFFQLLLIWAFVKARSNPRWYLLAPVVVAVGLYSYQPLKLMGPLLFAICLVHEWPAVRRNLRPLLRGFGLALLIALPSLVLHLSRWSIISREWSFVSIFQGTDWPLLFFRNYLAHFDTAFWLVTYGIGLPVVLLGAWFAWQHRSQRLLVSWLVVAPIVGAFTLQQNPDIYHHRSAGLWVVLAVLFGLGILALRRVLRDPSLARIASLVILVWIVAFGGRNTWLTLSDQRLNTAFPQAVALVSQPAYRSREVVVTNLPHPGMFYGLFTLFLEDDRSLFKAPKAWTSWVHPYWDLPIDYLSQLGRFRFCDLTVCWQPHDGRLYIVWHDELPNLPRLATFRTPESPPGFWYAYDVVDNR